MLLDEISPHGGDIYTHNVELDFSTNINPYGMPPKVADAIRDSVADCIRYPDPYCTKLREKISEDIGVSPERILCGNGAAELIYAFVAALKGNKPALIISPTFSEYEAALIENGIAVEFYDLKKEGGFRLTEKILTVDFARYCAVFVCSPNNPTGIMVEKKLLLRLADSCMVSGTRLFCDFCFYDLSELSDMYDIPSFIKKYSNVIVLQAFTKSYGMAGIRLGYCLGSDALFLARMSKKVQCWNVSVPAQAAGIAALECKEWFQRTKIMLLSEKKRMESRFAELGISVYQGSANYLLLYSELPLYEELLLKGILVRSCENYRGLGKGYIRIGIKLEAENEVLLNEIEEIVRKEVV